MQHSDSFSGHEQQRGRGDFGFTPTNKAEKANPMYIGDEFSPSNHRNQHQMEDEIDIQGGSDAAEQVKVLKEKQRRLNKALAKQEEDHKQQLLQIETVSMMTKYQLVFIKMETNLVRVVNIIKAKDNFNLLVGFKAILAARNAKVLAVKYKANLVYTSFRARVTTMVRALNRVKKMLLSRAFNKLSLPFKVAKKVGENQKYLARQLEELTEKMRKREGDTQAAARKLEELNGHILAAKSREMELVNKIKSKERAIANLENELAAQYQSKGKKAGYPGQHGDMDSMPNAAEMKIMEQQLRELESENAELRDKLSSTENNVGTFIKEMSDLLDSHELSTNACSEDNNNSLNNSQNAPPHGHHGQHNQHGGHHHGHGGHHDDEDLMEMVPKGGQKHGKSSKNHPSYVNKQQQAVIQQQVQQGKGGAAYNPMKSNRNYQIN